MTTIAYRDGKLAADTLSTANGVRDDYGPKVWRIGQVIGAACGSRGLCLKFRDWVAGGMDGDCPFEGADDGNGIIVTPEHVVCFGSSGPWPVSQAYYAIGSGYQLAMGAMEMGATAEQGVQVAMKWDCSTGGDVQVISL